MATKNTDKVVRIKLATWNRLAAHAEFTDTIDSVISKILDKLEQKDNPKPKKSKVRGTILPGPKCVTCDKEMFPNDMVVKHFDHNHQFVGHSHAECMREVMGKAKFISSKMK